jgi:hypothetical protein
MWFLISAFARVPRAKRWSVYHARMFIYAGIDEAGYGPMFGPLLVGRVVIAIPRLDPEPAGGPPNLWQRLKAAVCKSHQSSKGRIVVNDSKKVHTGAHGLRHLERGVLPFAALAPTPCHPGHLSDWLDFLGETAHHHLDHLPWYRVTDARPWEPLPHATTAGELAVAGNLLKTTCERIGVAVADIGAAVVFEDRFNQLVSMTRSKASTSFSFVARHLDHLWQTYGEHHPRVVVDRQSGRMRYREPLQECFPGAQLTVLEETPPVSAYHIASPRGSQVQRSLTVSFEVEADGAHFPVALASMVSKYTRELLMARFQSYFTACAPDIKPTAGYALDAKRFWTQIEPRLSAWGIDAALLRRSC